MGLIGGADAQYVLGHIYRHGKRVDEDPAAAAEWYRLAAEQGLAREQAELGSHYDHGIAPFRRREVAELPQRG